MLLCMKTQINKCPLIWYFLNLIMIWFTYDVFKGFINNSYDSDFLESKFREKFKILESMLDFEFESLPLLPFCSPTL